MAVDETLFSQIVLAAFSQRRKTLRNALQQYLTVEDFSALNIDSGLRAENLPVEKFVAITNFLT
jgi:16S rRNA (adenine1518-N6/adenine1519-N6)-dimethyltransferase